MPKATNLPTPEDLAWRRTNFGIFVGSGALAFFGSEIRAFARRIISPFGPIVDTIQPPFESLPRTARQRLGLSAARGLHPSGPGGQGRRALA